jgi:hypothetical protein
VQAMQKLKESIQKVTIWKIEAVGVFTVLALMGKFFLS